MNKFYGSLVALLLLSAALSAERRTGSPLEIFQAQAQTALSPTILYLPDYVDETEEWPVPARWSGENQQLLLLCVFECAPAPGTLVFNPLAFVRTGESRLL